MYKNDGIYNTVCPRDCFGVCSLKVSVENGLVTKVAGNNINENSEGKICIKGASYTKRLYHPDRLQYPLYRENREDAFRRISWDDVLRILSKKLEDYKPMGSESVMYLSGWGHAGGFNKYANGFWSQYGSVTTTYGSLCMSAGSMAVKTTYGQPIKHNHNKDLVNSKLIIVWGANPANTNIHRMRYIKEAVKQGAKLIVIDPRVSETMIDGALRVHPKPGTDTLLAFGISKLMIENNIIDEAFIKSYVQGFDAYKAHLDNYTMDYICRETELDLEIIKEIVNEIEENPIYALVSGTGKVRHRYGGQTERAVCSLPALTGSIGKSGGGLYFTDNQHPKLNWPITPTTGEMKAKIHVSKLGYELKNQIPDIKMLWVEKANPLASSPDTNAIKEAFKQLEFIVCVEHFMSETAEDSNLVLPAAMFAEKDDLIMVYGDSYIHLLQKLVKPFKEAKSEPEIYRLLGQYMDFDMTYLPEINETFINRVLDCSQLNTDYKSLQEKPFIRSDYEPIAYKDLQFNTPSGKIELMSDGSLPTYTSIEKNKNYPLLLLSSHAKGRINSQFKEMKLNKERPILHINQLDAEIRHIKSGDHVLISNDLGRFKVEVSVGEEIKAGVVHMYEGWGKQAPINKLIKGDITDIGNGTVFHNNYVEIKRL